MTALSIQAEAAEKRANKATETIEELNQKIQLARLTLESLQQENNMVTLSLKQQEAIVAKRKETEMLLTNEATHLLTTLSKFKKQNIQDHDQLSRFHSRDVKLRKQGQETSEQVETETINGHESLQRHAALVNKAADSVDMLSRETSCSMLGMSRKFSLAAQQHFTSLDTLSEKLNTSIGDDVSRLASLQRTISEAVSSTKTNAEQVIIPRMQGEAKLLLEQRTATTTKQEMDLSTWSMNNIVNTATTRMEKRKEMGKRERETFGAEERKKEREEIHTIETKTNEQVQHLNSLTLKLNDHHDALLSHRSELQQTVKHVSNFEKTTLKKIDTETNTMEGLQELTSEAMDTAIEEHLNTMKTSLADDLGREKISKKLTCNAMLQTKRMQEAVSFAQTSTSSMYENFFFIFFIFFIFLVLFSFLQSYR